LPSVPPPGVLGAATGEIATGTVATLRSTTTIITTRTTISTVTSIAKAKVIGSIIRNTAEMRRMVTGELRTSSVAMRVSSRADVAVLAAGAEPVVQVGLVELAAQVDQEALAELAVQAALGELELVPVVAAQELDPVAVPVLVIVQEEAELERVQVEGVPGLVQVEGVPELDPVVVPLRTKSVIAAHHHGQVPAPRVEDSAVAAQTTREPVAAEAVIAWAVAE